MRVKALRNFSGARWGNVSIGQVLELSEHLARQMIADDLVAGLELPEKKFYCETIAPLSLEVGQASPKSNANTLTDKDQKDFVALSQSTQATEQLNAMRSMPATGHGGSNTTAKRLGRPKSSQQTNGQPKNTV